MLNVKPIFTNRILINLGVVAAIIFFLIISYFISTTPPSREKYSHGMDRIVLSQQATQEDNLPLFNYSQPVTEKLLNTELYSTNYFISNKQFAKDTIEYCGKNALSSQNALTNCNNASSSQNGLYQLYVAFNLVSAVDILKDIAVLILGIMIIYFFKILGREGKRK